MPVLAQFSLVTSVLTVTLEQIPDGTVKLRGYSPFESGAIGLQHWVDTAHDERFKAGLRADPTVEAFTVLTEESDRTLFQTRLTDAGRKQSFVPLLGEFGVEFVDGRWTGDVWILRLRFPTDDAFRGFVDACRTRDDVSLSLGSVYQQDRYDGEEYALTPSQREALSAALERGYFDIPRETTLEDIADQLGVSDQAVSERLRRAQKRVFERVLVTNEK